jgi:hypothetical protein
MNLNNKFLIINAILVSFDSESIFSNHHVKKNSKEWLRLKLPVLLDFQINESLSAHHNVTEFAKREGQFCVINAFSAPITEP